MTVKRKAPDSSDLQIVNWGVKTNTWRAAVIILILSMHPIGRQLLGTFGFEFPDQRKLSVAADEAKASRTEITQLAESAKDLRQDVAQIKANNATLNTRFDAFEQTFSGFRVDFNKWKSESSKP